MLGNEDYKASHKNALLAMLFLETPILQKKIFLATKIICNSKILEMKGFPCILEDSSHLN